MQIQVVDPSIESNIAQISVAFCPEIAGSLNNDFKNLNLLL